MLKTDQHSQTFSEIFSSNSDPVLSSLAYLTSSLNVDDDNWLLESELKDLEARPDDWARYFWPSMFSRPFTSYQTEFLGWAEAIKADSPAVQPRVECEPRGVGKSTIGRTIAIYLMAKKIKSYILIVSATDNQARKHFAVLKKQLENPKLLAHYPHLRPQKSVHRNIATNWSANRIVTAEGQVIEFISVLGNARGFNTEEGRRLDLVLLDDIDDQKDSVDVTTKKLDIIGSNILGAGAEYTDIIYLQNLIHRTSICTLLRDNNAGILVNRKFVGPFPLCRVFAYREEKVEGDETGAKNYVLTDFQPFDPATSREYVQTLLNRLGPKVFQRECQQDLSVVDEDKDFREYSEIHHVITYSEFFTYWKRHGVNVLNEQRNALLIPIQWNIGLGQDWGCLTLDTEILTLDGWKRHSELTIGETVAGYDWRNKRSIVWTKLNNIVYKEDQPLVDLQNKSYRFRCTPDHSWIVKRGKRGRMTQDTYRRQRLDMISRAQTSLVIAAPCLESGTVECTPAMAAVLGWLVTDGWISKKGRGIGYLCQKNYCEQVIQDLNASGLEWKELTPKPNGVRIFRIGSDELQRLRTLTGFTDKDSLPSVATRLSSDAREAMLRSLLLAEGTSNGTSRMAIFCQRRGAVSDAFQILATMSGIRLGVEREHQSQFGESNRIPLLRSQNITVPEPKAVEGLHRVWCPSVNEGAVVARYQGQVSITGNTTVQHPAAIAPVARPNRGTLLSDSFFVFGEVVTPHYPRDVNAPVQPVSPGRVALAEKDHLKKWNVDDSQITLRLMSHEASAALNSYAEDLTEDLKVHYGKWKAARGSGVPQLQQVLEINFAQDHPFRKYPLNHPDESKRGQPIKGCPRFFILVPDNQGELKCDEAGHLYVAQPINSDGCARLRGEMPVYSQRNTGKSKIFDDMVDALRGLMGEYAIIPKGLTSHEQYKQMLAKHAPELLPENIDKIESEEERSLLHANERVIRAEFEEKARQSGRVSDGGILDRWADEQNATSAVDRIVDQNDSNFDSDWREL